MTTHSRSQARIIEIGDVTAGIVVPEHEGFRFFSAQRRFDPLDRRLFRSIKQVTAAAQDRLRRNSTPGKDLSPRAEDMGATFGLMLAAPGPFLLPV